MPIGMMLKRRTSGSGTASRALGIELIQIRDGEAESRGSSLQDVVVVGFLARNQGGPERHGFLPRFLAQPVEDPGLQNLFQAGDEPLIRELHLTSSLITN